MNVFFRIWVCNFFLLFNLIVFVPNVQAEALEDVLKDFRAKLFAYFKNQPDPIIPIFLPSGEVPGDVYRDAFGGYFARQDDCFKNPKITGASTRLLRVLDTKSADITGEFKGRITEAARAGAQAGFDLDERIEIQFAHVTISICSDTQLRKTFRSDEKECAPVGKLMTNPGEGNSALILGQVFIGRQIVETTASVLLSGQAGGQADLDIIKKKLGRWAKALEKIGLSLDFSGKIDVTGSRKAYTKISLTDERRLPIGYRPAFVSQRHLKKILMYIEKGDLRAMEDYILKTEKVLIAAKEYRYLVVPTKQLIAEMVSGELIPFDEKNPKHIEYLRGIGLLLSVGTEVESR